jgi:hypothetical protein
MRKFGFLLFLSNLCLCVSLHAQIVNGSFSTGTFSGWSILGNPTIDSGTPPSGAAHGALISTTNTDDIPDSVTYDEIQNSLGVILPSTNIGTEAPVNGEAIYQTITLTAPSTLTFQYQTLFQDARYPTTDEIGYSLTNTAQITGENPDPGTFYSIDASTLDSYTTITSSVIAPGTYILGFIAYNTDDEHGLTQFEVSEIDVPEPATWMLMVGAAVLLAGLYRWVPRPCPAVG